MSRIISFSEISDDDLDILSKDLEIQKYPPKFVQFAKPTTIYTYDVVEEHIYIPFAYSTLISRPERKNLEKVNVTFRGKLRVPQKEVEQNAISILNTSGSVIIAAYPGFGKTCVSLSIASKIKLKTLILCHRIILMKQWKTAIHKFLPEATVCDFSDEKSNDKDGDFLIMNAANVHKYGRKFFSSVGFLIVDEIHIIMAEKMSECMKYIVPRYVLGLSATPYRKDGLNVLMDLYFGIDKIEKPLRRAHILYKLETGFKPNVELTKQGKVIWDSILKSQAENTERNELIIRLIKFFPDRVILVLCKRVAQAKYIFTRLQEEKESVTSLIGKEQTFDEKSRILVATSQKGGVGFDHPTLNAIIFATDFEGYFEQYIGRAFRTIQVEPIFIDLIDTHGILAKHAKTRTNTCLECEGVVKNFRKEFPKFFYAST